MEGLTLEQLQKKGAKPVTKGLTLAELQGMGAKPAAVAEPTPAPGYFSRVGSAFEQAGKDVVSAVNQGASAIEKGLSGQANPLQVAGGVLRTGLRTAGEVAGAAFAPITEAPGIKQGIEKVGELATNQPDIKNLVTKLGEVSKKYPEASKDAQAILNIVTLGGGKAAAAPLKGEVKAIGEDIVGATKAALTPSEEAVQSKITSLFQKSIKPTAKKTVAQGEKYQNDTLNALKTIKNNADSLNIEDANGELVSGRTPESINELAQAMDQTKKTVFKQYDDLAKQAGTSGATVDAKPISQEILKVADNKALQLTNPELISYAKDWSKRLKDFDVLDTETTQAVIQNLNNNLQSFYRNPTYDSASKVAIDAGIANNFRVALDKAIEGATGKEYQTLKNQYSSLKAIENDVTRAAMRDARKNVKGLLDYSDIFTGGQMITGILSMNPAMFTKGAIEKGFKEYIKFLNDPNRAIKNIFEQLGKTTDAAPFEAKSAVGKFIQKPSAGLSVNDVSKDIKVTPEVKDVVSKALSEYDPTPLTVNGKIDMTGSDNSFRLMEMKKLLDKKNGLSTPEIQEALTRMKKEGIDPTIERPVKAQSSFKQDPKTGKMAGSTASIPKELEPLAKEAQKYKSAEEFKKNITAKQLREFLNATGQENAKTASGKATGARVRKEGDYLYNQDREYFNAHLRDIQTGTNAGQGFDADLTDFYNKVKGKK